MRFTVKNREIYPSNGTPVFLIGDNADYKAQFDFDPEWNGVVKTARFVRGKKFQEVVIVNDECEIPIEVLKQGFLEIGVFSAEMTTTPCRILVKGSIKELGGMTAEPTPDVYSQIISMIENIEISGVTDEQIEKAVTKYLSEHPIEALTEADVQRIVAEYVAAHKEEFKGEKGDKGDTGASGRDGLDGSDGADGKSAYYIAVDNGFVGTEVEWLASLHGKNGKDGQNGTDGKDGATGEDGYTPQKGVDYWTSADIAEIHSYIDNQIGGALNGSY